jgi:hypothetical protein
MGIDIKITDSQGRRHSDMAGMLKSETDRIVDDHLQAMRRAIESVRCDIHGERATVTFSKSAGKATFNISGCCDELVEKAEAAADRV